MKPGGIRERLYWDALLQGPARMGKKAELGIQGGRARSTENREALERGDLLKSPLVLEMNGRGRGS